MIHNEIYNAHFQMNSLKNLILYQLIDNRVSIQQFIPFFLCIYHTQPFAFISINLCFFSLTLIYLTLQSSIFFIYWILNLIWHISCCRKMDLLHFQRLIQNEVTLANILTSYDLVQYMSIYCS